MRPGRLTASLLLLACASACGSRHADSAIDVIVSAPAEVPADCLQVAAIPPSGPELETVRFPRGGGTEFHVAVFPGAEVGTEQVVLVARGFGGAGCQTPTSRSEERTVRFGPGTVSVTLVLAALNAPVDGGGDGGVDPVADGGEDGGAADSGPEDAGPDAGPDAGLDAGRPDAGGPPDAGPCLFPKDAGAPCGAFGVCARDGTCLPGFRYPPSNFVPGRLPDLTGAVNLDCNTSFDSTSFAFGANWCGQPRPTPWVFIQDGGSEAVVLAMGAFTLPSSRTLTLTGARPVILAIFGDATIDGTLLADAGADLPDCAGSHGAKGGNDPVNAGAGGGGAGFGASGGAGGAGGPSGGDAGGPHGTEALVPLTGGCSGAAGGNGPTGAAGGTGGSGGGAVQLSASGTLRVSGIVAVPGGGGRRGDNWSGGGGAGAGSGGAILLEGRELQLLAGAALTANGGGGGEGGGTNNIGIDGQGGSIDSDTPAQGGDQSPPTFPGFGGNGGAGTTFATDGEQQNSWNGGGGGGGASFGRIRMNGEVGCAIAAAVISPPASGNAHPGCP